MEELITLHYGNFAILGKGQKSMPKGWIVPTEWQTALSSASCSLMRCKRNLLGGIPPLKQEWSLFLMEWMFHNATAMPLREAHRRS